VCVQLVLDSALLSVSRPPYKLHEKAVLDVLPTVQTTLYTQ
jgi:hypothetical protein